MKLPRAKELTESDIQRAVLLELATVCPHMTAFELWVARYKRAEKWDGVRVKGLAAKLGAGKRRRL